MLEVICLKKFSKQRSQPWPTPKSKVQRICPLKEATALEIMVDITKGADALNMGIVASDDIPWPFYVGLYHLPAKLPHKCMLWWLFNMQNAFLFFFFQCEQAPGRNAIKFKCLMKYLILYHLLCFYLVSKTEPVYKRRPWNIGLRRPQSINKKEALGQHVSYKKVKAEFRRNRWVRRWSSTDSQGAWVQQSSGKGSPGTMSLAPGLLMASLHRNRKCGL